MDFKISEEQLKKYHGVYSSEIMPIKFKVFTIDGKLALDPVSRNQPLILDAVSSSSFKQEIAGIEVSFSDKKMKLKIQGREIEFKLDK